MSVFRRWLWAQLGSLTACLAAVCAVSCTGAVPGNAPAPGAGGVGQNSNPDSAAAAGTDTAGAGEPGSVPMRRPPPRGTRGEGGAGGTDAGPVGAGTEDILCDGTLSGEWPNSRPGKLVRFVQSSESEDGKPRDFCLYSKIVSAATLVSKQPLFRTLCDGTSLGLRASQVTRYIRIPADARLLTVSADIATCPEDDFAADGAPPVWGLGDTAGSRFTLVSIRGAGHKNWDFQNEQAPESDFDQTGGDAGSVDPKCGQGPARRIFADQWIALAEDSVPNAAAPQLRIVAASPRGLAIDGTLGLVDAGAFTPVAQGYSLRCETGCSRLVSCRPQGLPWIGRQDGTKGGYFSVDPGPLDWAIRATPDAKVDRLRFHTDLSGGVHSIFLAGRNYDGAEPLRAMVCDEYAKPRPDGLASCESVGQSAAMVRFGSALSERSSALNPGKPDARGVNFCLLSTTKNQSWADVSPLVPETVGLIGVGKADDFRLTPYFDVDPDSYLVRVVPAGAHECEHPLRAGLTEPLLTLDSESYATVLLLGRYQAKNSMAVSVYEDDMHVHLDSARVRFVQASPVLLDQEVDFGTGEPYWFTGVPFGALARGDQVDDRGYVTLPLYDDSGKPRNLVGVAYQSGVNQAISAPIGTYSGQDGVSRTMTSYLVGGDPSLDPLSPAHQPLLLLCGDAHGVCVHVKGN